MSIFKAYDIRGIYPKELNEETAYKIGRAFVTFLNCKEVVVGRDIRLSSKTLFNSLTKGITDQGANVIDLGLCSTDMFYLAVGKYNHESGIMITASHNLKEYNGFKFVKKQVTPIHEENGLKEIEKLVNKNNFKKAEKGKITKKNVLKDYINFVLSFTNIKKIKPIKIVMDPSNGIGGKIIPHIFKNLNIEIIPLNFKLDGNFPNHEPNPLIEKNRKQIIEAVLKEKADLGIAWDGDFDRCFFIDEKGNFLQGDFITALIAEKMLKENPNKTVLYDLRASHFVKDTIKKNNGIPKKCRVGHAFFKKYMRDEKALFGGEITGHYYYNYGNFYAENGIIPILQILELISLKNKKLSQLLEPAKNYFKTEEINFEVKDKDRKIKEIENNFKNGKLSYLDGLTVEFEDFWFNLRKSNTESLLRLNLEAKSKEKMEGIKNKIIEIIKK